MRVLGLFFGDVNVWFCRHILASVHRGDTSASRRHRVCRNTHAVGTNVGYQRHVPHAGDVETFVQLLRHAHCNRTAHAQFVYRVLLHCAGRKGRLRTGNRHAALDIAHYVIVCIKYSQRFVGLFLVFQFKFLAVFFRKDSLELRLGRGLFQLRGYVPVFFRLEVLYFLFAVNQYTKRSRLHATCGQIVVNFFTKHGAYRVTYQSVKHAASLLRSHKSFVDVVRVFDGFIDGFLRNFVEHDTIFRFRVKPKRALQVVRYCFSFAVRVGCEIDAFRLRHFTAKSVYCLCLLRLARLEVGRVMIGKVDTHRLDGQVPDVPLGRVHTVIGTEIFADSFGFCRRFDNYKFHLVPPISR